MNKKVNLEQYLQTIYQLSLTSIVVKSIDVSKKLKVSRPQVVRALNALKMFSYVEQAKYGKIQLTPSGRKLCMENLENHFIIKAFLMDIFLVNEKTAENTAVMIENSLPKEVIDKMKTFDRKTFN